MGNARSNKAQNCDQRPQPKSLYERVGTDSDYVAYRHYSMNNVDCKRDGPLHALMLDCSSQVRVGQLYAAFHGASPRRKKSIECWHESATLSKVHKRKVQVDDVSCELAIEERTLPTCADTHNLCLASIRKCQIFHICFCVNCEKSFQNAQKMCTSIRREKGDDEQYAITFVVMHCELKFVDSHDVLSRSAMLEVANAHNASYVETSFILQKNADCAIDLFACRGTKITLDTQEESKQDLLPAVHAAPPTRPRRASPPPPPARDQQMRPRPVPPALNPLQLDIGDDVDVEADLGEDDVAGSSVSEDERYVQADESIRLLQVIGQRLRADEAERADSDDVHGAGNAQSDPADRPQPLDAPPALNPLQLMDIADDVLSDSELMYVNAVEAHRGGNDVAGDGDERYVQADEAERADNDDVHGAGNAQSDPVDVPQPLDAPLSKSEDAYLDNLYLSLQQQNVEQAVEQAEMR